MASPKVRGIQTVEYTNADGQEVEKYRVRIVRKDFKADRYFDDFDEAKEFLALSKVKKGKEILPTSSEIIQVADAFECPIDELLFESSNRASDQAQVIVRMLEGLPQEERAVLLETLDLLSSQFKKSLAKRATGHKR